MSEPAWHQQNDFDFELLLRLAEFLFCEQELANLILDLTFWLHLEITLHFLYYKLSMGLEKT